jgi:hypothetical protein
VASIGRAARRRDDELVNPELRVWKLYRGEQLLSTTRFGAMFDEVTAAIADDSSAVGAGATARDAAFGAGVVSLATALAMTIYEARLEDTAVQSYNSWAARHGCEDHGASR